MSLAAVVATVAPFADEERRRMELTITHVHRFVLQCCTSVALFVGVLHAASFDCGKARTPTEKLVCSDAGLSKADEEMAAAYRKARDLASQWVPDDAKDLKEDQVEWWQEEVRGCTDRKYLAHAYKERNDELAFYAAHVQSNSSSATAYTGTYLMGHQGSKLEVVQLNGAIKFTLHVVRVFNLGTGNVGQGDAFGTAPLNNGIAVYGARMEFADPSFEECRITMTFHKTKATISQKGDCGMGLNVSADGTYIKFNDSAPANAGMDPYADQ